MSKFCVKKPFTVLVAVIIVLTLSAVSLTKMTTDLLPEIDLPYMMVVTTDPGASPEKVENDVTKPLESALGTVTGVTKVTSSSRENVSIVLLEFADGTNMDSTMVKVNTALNQVKESLPDTCGASNVMELSIDMVATMYTSVNYEGKDIYELSDFVSDTLLPRLERLDGVASVSTMGLVEQTVEVRLDQSKIDELNDKLLVKVSSKLDKAKKELNSAKGKLDKAQAQLEAQQESTSGQLGQASQATDQMSSYETQLTNQQASLSALQQARQAIVDQLADNGVKLDEVDDTVNTMMASSKQLSQLYRTLHNAGMEDSMPLEDLKAAAEVAGLDEETVAAIDQLIAQGNTTVGSILTSAETLERTAKGLQQAKKSADSFDSQITSLQVQIQVTEGILEQYKKAMKGKNYADIESAKIQAAAGFGSGAAQLQSAQDKLAEAEKTYQTSREEALKNANLNSLLSMDTLSSLIYAQNFEMPAGYVDDKSDHQWLLKVGSAFDSTKDLEKMLLCHVDGIGDVRLGDVAKVTVVDNAGETYAKVNGQDAIVLSIFKASTAGTSDVSKTCNKAIADLEKEYDGLDFTMLSDQGDYIKQFIDNIFSSMLWGAALAILVLAAFLKNVKPTLVVAFSIPFSVLVAALMMYFSGITLNIMSLAGLALGIGMLVDNSIVVIENIYRLRGRGIDPARASVQGARQVQGPILASTLTTVCVFLPMIFTTGYTRQLMLPFAMTITYALVASLLVSLTVVPTMSSVMLRKTKERSHRFFDALLRLYEKVLSFCLRVKLVPLLVSILLLAFSVVEVIRMGVVMIPDIGADQITVSMKLDDDIKEQDAYKKADEVMDAMLKVNHVDKVGVLAGGGASIMTSSMGTQQDFTTYQFMILPDETVTKEEQVDAICDGLEAVGKKLGCDLTVSASAMGDMSTLMGSGLEVDVYGNDLDKLMEVSQDIEKLIGQVEGFENITNGQEKGDDVLRLVIDKDKAMRKNLTVAQIYSAISAGLTTEKKAATVTIDGQEMQVDILDEEDKLTRENLMNLELESNTTDDEGKSVTKKYKLKDFAKVKETRGVATISRENNTRMIQVKADTKDGYNTTKLSDQVQKLLDEYEMPQGYSAEISGETENTRDMLEQMVKMLALGLLFIYLVMVAQFQSLLSPFIILFTVPLAFTGGLIGLLIGQEQLSIMSLIGFLVLMGTVVNNGIVFVDYVNQLRIAGFEKREALLITGKTRMRPILMTALTTILSMCTLVFSQDTMAGASRGMAIVVAGGLLYATFMTLFIVPVMYDILYRKKPLVVEFDEAELDDDSDLLKV